MRHATRRRLEAREICVLRAKYAHTIRNLEAKNAQLILLYKIYISE